MQRIPLISLTLLMLVLFNVALLHAQDETPTLTLTEEQDIGFDCPVATTQEPGTNTIWVLMDHCAGGDYWLQSYDMIDGEALGSAISLEEIDGDLYEVFNYNAPFAFTSDGLLQVFAVENDTSDLKRYVVDPESGEVTTNEAVDAQINTLLDEYTEYGAFGAMFSPDHTLLVISGDTGTYIAEVATGELVLEFEGEFPIAAFSPDTTRLYVQFFEDQDNFENTNTTLMIYSLPEGELLKSMPFQWRVLYPSFDENYLAYETTSTHSGEEQLGAFDLTTQTTSPLLEIHEPPAQLLTCANNGQDRSDVDFTVRGYLPIHGLQWLADNSGFVTLNSYGGDRDNTGCIFDYSRMRHYTLDS